MLEERTGVPPSSDVPLKHTVLKTHLKSLAILAAAKILQMTVESRSIGDYFKEVIYSLQFGCLGKIPGFPFLNKDTSEEDPLSLHYCI